MADELVGSGLGFKVPDGDGGVEGAGDDLFAKGVRIEKWRYRLGLRETAVMESLWPLKERLRRGSVETPREGIVDFLSTMVGLCRKLLIFLNLFGLGFFNFQKI